MTIAYDKHGRRVTQQPRKINPVPLTILAIVLVLISWGILLWEAAM